MRAAFAALVVTLAAIGLAPAVAAPPVARPWTPLAAHQVQYDFSLTKIERGDTVDASGDMTYRVIDDCDSWSTQQRLHLRTVSRNDGEADTVSDYATFESKDGRHLTFETVQISNGQIQSRIEGEASRVPDGHVIVHFRAPAGKILTLPVGTLFPLGHTQAIIDAARRGQRSISPMLFDGTSADGAFYTYVTIQSWSPHSDSVPAPQLANMGSAMVHVAFFSTLPGAIAPDFELGARYFENGISDHLRMDFGDFAMQGRDHDLTLLPASRCGVSKHL